jgi:hypothetical protein
MTRKSGQNNRATKRTTVVNVTEEFPFGDALRDLMDTDPGYEDDYTDDYGHHWPDDD